MLNFKSRLYRWLDMLACRALWSVAEDVQLAKNQICLKGQQLDDAILPKWTAYSFFLSCHYNNWTEDVTYPNQIKTRRLGGFPKHIPVLLTLLFIARYLIVQEAIFRALHKADMDPTITEITEEAAARKFAQVVKDQNNRAAICLVNTSPMHFAVLHVVLSAWIARIMLSISRRR